MSETLNYKRIYLTLYDPICEDEGPVWWCCDRADETDVEYVNIATHDADWAYIAELEHHEAETHETLGAILGSDDSLEQCAKRAIARIAELEAERNLYSARLDACAAEGPRLQELAISKMTARIAELEARFLAWLSVEEEPRERDEDTVLG